MTPKQQFLHVLIILGSWQLTHGTTIADTVFWAEDFDDIDWVTGPNDNLSFDDEYGLVMNSAGLVRAGIQGLDLTDMSVRSRVRVMEGGAAGIASRWLPNGSNYFGFLGSEGLNGIGIGGPEDKILANGEATDVDLSDMMLQLDVIGDQIDLWVWDPDELMPEEPTVSVQHGELTIGDFYIWGAGSFESQEPVTVAIRYVEVADLHILTGDFNRDGSLDIDDLESLTVAVRNNDNSLKHDVNNDEIINEQDRDFWVHDIKVTYFGDSNLNGEFNSQDFVQVFQAGEYEDNIVGNSTWVTGDWNGDTEFDSTDFVKAFQDGGFEQGPRAAVNAVPEPSCAILLSTGIIGLCRIRKSR